MSKPARHFRDPQSAAKLDCDALLEEAAAAGPLLSFLDGLKVGTELPAARPPGRLLVVRSGPWVEYVPPITAAARIRVVAWSLDADEAWDIASWFHASLLAYPGDDDVVAYRYELGPERGKDSDYDTPIAAFTMRARMRPAIL